MVQAHYHEAQELQTAVEWFAVAPKKYFQKKKNNC
jgi:hypothetical protein